MSVSAVNSGLKQIAYYFQSPAHHLDDDYAHVSVEELRQPGLWIVPEDQQAALAILSADNYQLLAGLAKEPDGDQKQVSLTDLRAAANPGKQSGIDPRYLLKVQTGLYQYADLPLEQQLYAIETKIPLEAWQRLWSNEFAEPESFQAALAARFGQEAVEILAGLRQEIEQAISDTGYNVGTLNKMKQNDMLSFYFPGQTINPNNQDGNGLLNQALRLAGSDLRLFMVDYHDRWMFIAGVPDREFEDNGNLIRRYCQYDR